MNSSKGIAAHALAEHELLKALTELANAQDDERDFERFVRRWPGLFSNVSAKNVPGAHVERAEQAAIPARFITLFARRETLRQIWRGNSAVLSEELFPTEPPVELYDDAHYAEGRVVPPQITADWHRGQFIYEPRTKFQEALYLLFRRSKLAKVCENPECPAPYFIATRSAQRYCSDQCAQIFQQQWKRKWWAEHGEAWRRSRKKPRRKPKRPLAV